MIQNKIKVYRAMNEMTQEDLAKKVGVVRQTIHAIENNKYVPSLSLAFKIAGEFGVDINEVFQFQKS
ncbi:helix-turn-helix transcriptional regulator [Candidatus Woesebacteria bacterium]|nr:helix-turn-helix transcriptional regulator [Candidatus Woesebacteria bacterium]